MRILILSDIHANLEALEACLAAAPPHDRVFNLGDIVGYGANPNEVTERSRELGTIFVRGNHDKACSGVTSLDDFNPIAGLAVLWTRQKLKPDNLSFLHDLPSGPIPLWRTCNAFMARPVMRMNTCSCGVTLTPFLAGPLLP